MDSNSPNAKIVTKLLFRLLPIQVVLAAVGQVNGLVSSFFASNYVGIDAMSAVGLYSPINMLLTAISIMLVGGTSIICGKYLGQNQRDKMQNTFSLNLMLAGLIGALFAVLFLLAGFFDLTAFFTRDDVVRPIFNHYLLGQAIGVIPMILGNQMAMFLSLEYKGKRTLTASLIYIVVNLILNVLFVQVLAMEAFGLALASALGMWVFFTVQLQYFLSGKSMMRVVRRRFDRAEAARIFRIGIGGAISNGYQTIRGLVVNWLLQIFIGTVGISAFAAANNLLCVFWAVPMGMLAVSRLLISVSFGEEDRQTLTDVMRVMFRRFVPLMSIISVVLILCAVPLTQIFFRDPAEPVYQMTVWGLRILPACMPFSIICMHFVCYGQASGKQGLVHILSALDGVICVAGFTAILIPFIGMNSAYIANVLNGLVCLLAIIIISLFKKKKFPKTMDELMVIPGDFGTPDEARMDLTVRNMEEVVTISRQVQDFCLARGVDSRRAMLSGLAMEEMAGNIVAHGFTKDQKTHSIDVRVVHKDDDLILRLKDDCIPFNPEDRRELIEGDDIMKNIGIRMVFQIAEDVQYQNMLGLNVLTVRI